MVDRDPNYIRWGRPRRKVPTEGVIVVVVACMALAALLVVTRIAG